MDSPTFLCIRWWSVELPFLCIRGWLLSLYIRPSLRFSCRRGVLLLSVYMTDRSSPCLHGGLVFSCLHDGLPFFCKHGGLKPFVLKRGGPLFSCKRGGLPFSLSTWRIKTFHPVYGWGWYSSFYGADQNISSSVYMTDQNSSSPVDMADRSSSIKHGVLLSSPVYGTDRSSCIRV